MKIEIDNYPVSDLPSRFNLGKQATYNRMDSLKIKATKTGNRSYITADQLDLLDKLHDHLVNGGLFADFPFCPVETVDKSSGQDSNLTTVKSDSNNQSLDALDKSTGLVDLIEAISKVIEKATPQQSPVWYMSELERVQAHGWMLTTSEIYQLIGVKPKLAKGSNSYRRGCFVFSKAGKIGNQTAWHCTKSSVDQPQGIYQVR